MSLVVQMVKNLPAMQETWVWFLGREDPLEEEMATHSSNLAWEIPWTVGWQKVGHDWATSLSLSLSCIEEGNGNPLQCSCLENPRDGGAWWAAVHGVAEVRHDWATSLSLFTFMYWRRKWQSTPVFLPGESQGRWSLVGCHLCGHTELDTADVT